MGSAKGKENRCNLWYTRRPAVLVRGGHRMVAPRDWERSKRHRHAGAEFLYQRHQLALGPAQGDEGVILIPPAASEEGVWVWAGKTQKLRVAGVQAWGT